MEFQVLRQADVETFSLALVPHSIGSYSLSLCLGSTLNPEPTYHQYRYVDSGTLARV